MAAVAAGSVHGRKRGSVSAPPNETPPRLLVIDDDPPVARFAAAALTLEGFRVQIAATGRAGLDAAETAPPDIILLDLALPGMHGLAVLSGLRAHPATSTIPVVILTAGRDPDAEGAALALGAAACLHKPIGAGVLVSAVRRALAATGTARVPLG
jgi:DNA-binding response OmpR family regulator